jgi:DNA polymerase III subunit delta'
MWQVVGHETAVTLLQNSLNSGRLSHAYLFVGPEHVGKMTLALNLAQVLNCEAEEAERPCTSCTQCKRIAGRIHADIQILETDGRTEIGIDQIRALEQSANLKPFEGRTRVFIIDGAEKLSIEAGNSLLKILEEPPHYVQFILLASNERLLLPTVLSRCHKLELRPVPIAKVEQSLIRRWNVAPEQAGQLARLSAGCPGWAVQASRDDRILSDRASRLDTIQQLVTQGRAPRFAYASDLANQFIKNRATATDILNLWACWWHDLLLTKGGCIEFATNADREHVLSRDAANYRLSQIKGFIDSLRDVTKALEQNSNPRLTLEVLMLNIPKPAKGMNASR